MNDEPKYPSKPRVDQSNKNLAKGEDVKELKNATNLKEIVLDPDEIFSKSQVISVNPELILKALIDLTKFKKVSIKQINTYPFKIDELTGCKHFSIPGTACEGVKNIILLTVLPDRLLIEYYTSSLKCDSQDIPHALDFVNEINTRAPLDVAFHRENCIFRITINVWVSAEWNTITMQSAIWSSIRHSTFNFKDIAKEILLRFKSVQPTILKVTIQPSDVRVFLKQMLKDREISYMIIKASQAIAFSREFTDFEGIKRTYKGFLTVNENMLDFVLTNDEFELSYSQSTVNLIACKLNLTLKISKLNLSKISSSNYQLQIKSSLLFGLLSNFDFQHTVTSFFESTLEEFKFVLKQFDKYISDFSKQDVDYAVITRFNRNVLDFSEDSSSESEEDENRDATHFKAYSQSINGRREINLITRLKTKGLLGNFGLNTSIAEGDSLSSLTFHTPPVTHPLAKPFKQMMEMQGEADHLLVLEDLEKLIESLREVHLQFIEMSEVNFYWTSDHNCQSGIGLYVFCKDYLFEMLVVTDFPLETQVQIQQFLAKQNKLSALSTESEEDMAHIKLDTDNCPKKKMFVTSLDGVSKVCIYRKNIKGMTSSDLKQVCTSLYRAYQVNRHPNLLICYGYKLIVPQMSIYFAFEHCNLSLYTFISQGMHFPNPIKFLRDIASGLGYLSSKPFQNICINPKRILIDSKYRPKLMPFYSKLPESFEHSNLNPREFTKYLQNTLLTTVCFIFNIEESQENIVHDPKSFLFVLELCKSSNFSEIISFFDRLLSSEMTTN